MFRSGVPALREAGSGDPFARSAVDRFFDHSSGKLGVLLTPLLWRMFLVPRSPSDHRRWPCVTRRSEAFMQMTVWERFQLPGYVSGVSPSAPYAIVDDPNVELANPSIPH